MQAFRQEYGLRGTVAEATQLLWEYVHLMPGHFLSFSYSYDHGSYVCCCDAKKFDESVLTSEEKWRTCLCGVYLLYQALNADMMSIRNGVIFVYECEGFSLGSMSMKTAQRLCTEVYGSYPTLTKQMKYFHSGMVFNVLLSFCKQFLPRDLKSKFETGNCFEGRLDTYYLVPNLESSHARFYARILETITRRYHEEEVFRL
ncbi:expressed unknown protein [Seminavis robusta]|uniref:CRAL-TRIO domain-containing protein n=1 Tax=Seminavis robusta TaxID=568900 RepID=A0A9N8DZT7_9STRA|nr:expressed unknown protein [Seminavis robusta]|eukprot:Sro372_g128890.1 n/a (201) ;mRNA; f:62559-63161